MIDLANATFESGLLTGFLIGAKALIETGAIYLLALAWIIIKLVKR